MATAKERARIGIHNARMGYYTVPSFGSDNATTVMKIREGRSPKEAVEEAIRMDEEARKRKLKKMYDKANHKD